MDQVFLGIDVGTGSVRAGLFDGAGRTLGTASEPITLFRPEPVDFVEQSSEDIWRAAGVAVRAALARANLAASAVRGIGFDATCSLVLLDEEDRPVSASPSGRDEQNVIVWMDHRAMHETEFVNQTGDDVLRYVGGRVSVEMQIPKLLWLKRHLPRSFARTARFFDLPDFLTYRATGCDQRSLCSTACKWTYLGHAGGWSRAFFEQVGLADLLAEDARRIGAVVRPLGERVGPLTARAAEELGLVPGIPVGVSIIDAHAGGLGVLGIQLGGSAVNFDERIALIGGTSTCHMAVSSEPRFVPGVWGPYFSAMLPGLWLNEGGQSATGALIDFVIDSHARGAALRAQAAARGTTAYALLNQRLSELAQAEGLPLERSSELTRDVHVLPDHHGNRSPRADASLRGMVSGLRLTDSEDALALLYLATVQALAYGTRHILETLGAHGYAIHTLIATGGDTKNELFVREHANATGCSVVLPDAAESVLLGSAMLGATASGAFPSLDVAMGAMSRAAKVIAPDSTAQAYHRAKYAVFQRLYADQMAYRQLMSA
jgi:FGGY-family pentulose kinase